MMTDYVTTGSVPKETIKQVIPDIEEWQIPLLITNLESLYQANLTEDIKHIKAVWDECGVQ